MDRMNEIERRIEERQREIDRRIAERMQGCFRQPDSMPKTSGGVDMPQKVSVPKSSDGTRRMALCVGMDRLDATAYGGWEGVLSGCIIDVLRFGRLFESHGVQTKVLENANATIANVGQAMADAAAALTEGDLFMMVVSGHGGRENVNGRNHENWCLYDGCVWDDDIIGAFSAFQPGVRILVINDQCHSGGVFLEKAAPPCRARYWGVGVTDAAWMAETAVKDSSFPMLVQFAGCRAEQMSLAGNEGSTWSLALVRALEAQPGCTFRDWFDRAFIDKTLQRGRQDPQWVEKGQVTDDFRNGVVFPAEVGR